MRKIIIFCSIIALAVILFMPAALAADINITADGTYTITPSDTSITIAPNLTVTLIGSSSVTYDLPIVCGQGVSLTLQDVRIKIRTNCALSFTGGGNQLILTGDNVLITLNYPEPGIRVEESTSLIISGHGALNVHGGRDAAGIGGGSGSNGGNVTVLGGDIFAYGGEYGAGIGGGRSGSGGTITIFGGNVDAFGGDGGAGIGGGDGGSVGTITISGGTVNATSLIAGAGIGSGAHSQRGGTISIEGGTVTATGGHLAAGIGGGFEGPTINIIITGGVIIATGGQAAAGIGTGEKQGSANITISGGVVYAEGDYSRGAHDIGAGYNAFGGTLTIAGTSAVFLRNDYCLPPVLSVPHTHKTTTSIDDPMQVVDGMIFGIPGTGVSPWTSATGGYFVLNHIMYNANGGSGSISKTTQQTGTLATIKQSTGITREGYTFSSWNTAANGDEKNHPAGSTLTLTTPNTTLYAQWTLVPQTGDAAAGNLYRFAALIVLTLAGMIVVRRLKAKKRIG